MRTPNRQARVYTFGRWQFMLFAHPPIYFKLSNNPLVIGITCLWFSAHYIKK